MNCPSCQQATLVQASFWFERLAPDGTRFRTEVSGLRCPACEEEILPGPEAERVSEAWYRLLDAITLAAPATTMQAVDNYAPPISQWPTEPVAA